MATPETHGRRNTNDEDDELIEMAQPVRPLPKRPVGRPRLAFDRTGAVEASERLMQELDGPLVKRKRPLFSEEDDAPTTKRPREPVTTESQETTLTSFQDFDLVFVDETLSASASDDHIEPSQVPMTSTERLELRRRSLLQRAREAAETRAEIITEMKQREDAQKREWVKKKDKKQEFVSLIELAPVDATAPRKKRSLFLVTITDNSSIIDASADTSELWIAPEFEDLVSCYTAYFKETPIVEFLRPGNNIKTIAACKKAINECVENVLVRVVRERAPSKGQAHIHMLVSVFYTSSNGFYPQINTDSLRSAFKRKGGEDGRFYVNVRYLKDTAYDAKKYMSVPPGEKKEAKSAKNYTPSVVV